MFSFYFGVELLFVFGFFCFTPFVLRYSQKEPREQDFKTKARNTGSTDGVVDLRSQFCLRMKSNATRF